MAFSSVSFGTGGYGLVDIKPGSWGSTGIGGIIFGVGLAILGYCPGTSAGAAGQGSLDALVGGVGGMIAGGMHTHASIRQRRCSFYLSLAPVHLYPDHAVERVGLLGVRSSDRWWPV